jgi:cytochrome c biogenesis factor
MTAQALSVIIYSFLTGDYSIVYVQRYSDAALPMFYKITSYWGGLDGSIMFWVFLLSLFGSAAIYINRDRHRELIPYVVAVISVVEMFFLYLMIVHNNPSGCTVLKGPKRLTGYQRVPQPGGPICTPGQDTRPVGREDDGVDVVRMTAEAGQHSLSGRVPEQRHVVFAP